MCGLVGRVAADEHRAGVVLTAAAVLATRRAETLARQ
jgi:hypothetical protein